MKDCGGCRQSKPVEEFYCRDGSPYGPCKSCRRTEARERYQARNSELLHLRTIVAAIGAQVTYAGSELA